MCPPERSERYAPEASQEPPERRRKREKAPDRISDQGADASRVWGLFVVLGRAEQDRERQQEQQNNIIHAITSNAIVSYRGGVVKGLPRHFRECFEFVSSGVIISRFLGYRRCCPLYGSGAGDYARFFQ